PSAVWGYNAQAGAEFVHGEAPLTCKLIEEAGLTLNHAVEWWDVRDGEPELVGHGPQLDKISPHDDLVEGKLAQLTEDITVKEFLDTYFPGEQWADLRSIIRQRVEYYDSGDVSRASAFGLREDMSNEAGWRQRNIKEGYTKLL